MKEKNEQLAQLIAAIHTAIEQAEQFAQANDLEFSLDLGYGMGGTFMKAETNHMSDFMGVAQGDYGWWTSTMSCN